MQGKIYFNLLIFCMVLSQGFATSEENVDQDKTSNLQIRKKRVISEKPESMPITKFPFLAHIKKYRKTICSGSIVSPHVILTVANCVDSTLVLYTILTGTGRANGSGGKYHNLIAKINHPRYRPGQFEHALSLITIEPTVIRERGSVGIIELQPGPTLVGVHGIVAGWGCNKITPNNERQYPDRLEAITVTVMRNDHCQYAYGNHTGIPSRIGENEICTLDIFGEKRCSHGDLGSPLVIFSRIAGLFIWSADEVGKPDIFVSVEHPDTHLWLSSNIQNVESHLQKIHSPHDRNDPHHLPYPHLQINLPANHHH